jgi:hypothetical protein
MKRATNTKKSSVKKLKTDIVNQEDEATSSFIDFQNGENAFKTFLGNDIDFKDFMDNYWEKKPLIIRRNENAEWLKFIKKLFNLQTLKNIISERKPYYELDINLCKLVNGKKKVFNKKGVVELKHLERSFEKDKVTIQFHQPQRFSVCLLFIIH